jgi:phosphoenolpyruvate carboxykinase (GTP)
MSLSSSAEVSVMESIAPLVAEWVNAVITLTQPAHVHWCDGSIEEKQKLEAQMVDRGELTRLNANTFPDCVLYRSDPQDVARTEHLTFISTTSKDTAGVNNNWMSPSDAHQLMHGLFAGCMRGRTLYVIPYCLGPLNSLHARCGVEITDSAYVVLNMRIMTRMGIDALKRIATDGKFTKGLHSTGDLDPARRYIVHYPEENLIESFGSGYGGNALLAKKCHALRIASWQALREGWLAEHMLIMGVQNPAGETHYIAAAFPSACGKTNLAMLTPPESMPGWRVFTIGDDIAWLYPGEDGRLWAMNPESGYFGVVPGTNRDTNKNAFDMIHSGSIFTNVGLTADNEPWWEGRKKNQPVKDWQGHDCVAGKPVAHPNARFTVTSSNNPVQSPMANDPRGVPLSAIIFGGRRASLIPLVCEADDWQRGVVMGASLASETTAAATGQTGIVRRDPMAMKPFCGYNMVDYWRHWLAMGSKLRRAPHIFQVNWFRKDAAGQFLWPGFGENLRVIQWMLDRCEGKAGAAHSAIGYLPEIKDMNLLGLDFGADRLRQLLEVNQQQWLSEIADLRAYFAEQGRVLPEFERVLDTMRSHLN